MLKHRQEQVQSVIRALDALIAVCSFFAAYWLRSSPWLGAELGVGTEIAPLESVSWLLAASFTIHLILYPLLSFYHSIRLRSTLDLTAMVVKAFVIEFFILGSLVFFVQAKSTSRYFFGLFLLINYSVVLAERLAAKWLLSSVRKRGYNFRRILIVGTGQNAMQVLRNFQRHPHWGYVVSGFLAEGPAKEIDAQQPVAPLLGVIEDLEKVVTANTIDEVYFALERIAPAEIAHSMGLCEKLGIPARISLGLFELEHSKVTFSSMGDLPVITFYTTLLTPFDAFVKRCMDIGISIAGLGVTAVLYPWISWRIKRESPGPVIFKQVRVGENGRRFKCYKFRTMRANAESMKSELEASNQMDGPIFKMENDPRITPFGRLLRRTSMDELPQFVNILRGDMSVVGTRPPTPDEVNRYDLEFRRRLSIRPGLTGLWQVSGRNQIKRFEDIVALDLEYIDRWSLWLDIRIILKTIVSVVRSEGA